jgi:hypothetical protein
LEEETVKLILKECPTDALTLGPPVNAGRSIRGMAFAIYGNGPAHQETTRPAICAQTKSKATPVEEIATAEAPLELPVAASAETRGNADRSGRSTETRSHNPGRPKKDQDGTGSRTLCL